MEFYTPEEIAEAEGKHSAIYSYTGCDSITTLIKDEKGKVIEFRVGLCGNLGHELKGCSMCYGRRTD